MLRPCTKEEFETYLDFAYALATDPAHTGYPIYCDGIKTKADFTERRLKAFERDDEEMLLFLRDGEIRGLIHYTIIPEDRYLQTIGFHIAEATEEALSDFLAYAGERCPGFDAFFGFPAENRAAVSYLSGRGFECIEDDWNNTAYPQKLPPIPAPDGLIRIGRENYGLFRALHDQIEGDMYWNSDRILADLDRWVVFVKAPAGSPRGAVYFTAVNGEWNEIFGVDIDRGEFDPALFRELLTATLADAQKNNVKFVTFFCEDAYEDAAKECGFVCVGNYLCYKTRLAAAL